MLESIVLGIIQGIVEWLPVSSEGMIVLVKNTFFPDTLELSSLIQTALFLHFGTFLAALVYFRKDVGTLCRQMLQLGQADEESRQTILFLTIATVISAIVGLVMMYSLIELIGAAYLVTARTVNIAVALLLTITGFLQLRVKKTGIRQPKDLRVSDAIILGFAQGLATLPGLSRSGLTVSALLLRRMEESQALRLSFLLSLPIVLGGNILMLLVEGTSQWNPASLMGLLAAFLFGLLTIHGLLKLARAINFGYFVLLFAGLMLLTLVV